MNTVCGVRVLPAAGLVLLLCSGAAFAAEDAANTGHDFVLYVGGLASSPSGDVALNTGLGLDFGVGFCAGPVTVRGVLGGSFHKIDDGGNLVLGDSVTVESAWDITYVGVDGQYAFRRGYKGQPFLSAGVAFAHLTHSGDDNVEGFQFSGGAGYEREVRRARISLALWSVLQVDYLRLNNAKAGGQEIDLPEPIDETVVTFKLGLAIYQ